MGVESRSGGGQLQADVGVGYSFLISESCTVVA